ncbi:hypothetical protein DPSP01_012786 [Paraphaeosphaeria sporulosa]|uniref:Rhodopsin domain-containing protein n=1 Tax=Paraphaeosphaeria sporulosa TaxID=1460663 RepID=A0A177CT01_9PLEO|nr:uncharacterized protein CC84DRAFT_1213971 [Paraphaeosphaeria sporulosa]OAG10665.1 hypothetical protein CC84DRAFT_1213971 [Paraphaeosphaeria sporulosa]
MAEEGLSSAICIVARFLARWRIQATGLGWDDWTILVAYILLIPSTIIAQLMTYKGMGQDIWAVPFDNITAMLKYFYIEQYIYQCVVVLTKISIVLLYLRIFPKEVSKRFQHVSTGVIVGLIIYGFGFIIYFAFQCRPINYFWNQWSGETEGRCVNQQFAVYMNSAMNIVFDLVVFFLPVPKLMKLQVRSTQRKIGFILTFLVGLFVTACSMVRLSTLANIGKVQNATYHYNAISLWSGLEGDVGVICACMPSLAGPILYFFRDVLGVKLTSFTKSGTNKTMNVSRSRITGNKSIARLPSTTASERDSRNDMGSPTAGGIEKTVVTSIYNLPYGYSSGDDVELIEQKPGHERMGQWNA